MIPTAMPNVQKTAMAESSRISFRLLSHSTPKADKRKYGSRQKRGDTGIQPQPDTAEGGMSDAAADEHQTACHNVGTYDAAGDAGKQTSQQGMPEESIM